jgi:formylglycine-generating enzyme required for sulfatase activity
VLPVIVRPCAFGDDPIISRLQALPTDGHPVTDRRHWHERDDAWLDVVAGLKRTLDLMREAEARKEQEDRDVEERKRRAAEQKKADVQRARQAEIADRERSERDRREAEQRTREEQARYEREAAAARQQEQQARRQKEEQERLTRQRQEQEEAYRRAEYASWIQAAKVDDVATYEAYLTQFPQGNMVQQARRRIREIKKANAQPFPAGRYAAYGGGALVLLLAIWLLPKIFGWGKEQPAGANTLSPSSMSENVGVQQTKKSGQEMVLVQGGKFDMGDVMGDKEYDNEKPVHSVTLSSFYLGKTEVTFDEYDAYCTATNTEKSDDAGWGRGNRPVINVSWFDAVEYCNWLSEKQNLTKVYTISGDKVTADWSATGYRLPTEAEWEYAARQRGQKVRFGNGKDIADPSEINFDGSADYKKTYSVSGQYREKTTPVGSFPANSLGLHDMSGNVWEWCWDWYGDYASGSQTNPHGAGSGSNRVLRGGSWINIPANARAARRGYGAPSDRFANYGFRLARAAGGG